MKKKTRHPHAPKKNKSNGRPFVCGYCNQSFAPEDFEKHFLQNHSYGGYKCWLVKLQETIQDSVICTLYFTVPENTTFQTIEKFLLDREPDNVVYFGQFYFTAQKALPWNKEIVTEKEYVLKKNIHIGDRLPADVIKYDFGFGTKIDTPVLRVQRITKIERINRDRMRPAVIPVASDYDNDHMFMHQFQNGQYIKTFYQEKPQKDAPKENDFSAQPQNDALESPDFNFNQSSERLHFNLVNAYEHDDRNGIINALYGYMTAATVFYGVVSFKDFQTLIKHYANIDIDHKLFIDTLNYAKMAYQKVNINSEVFAIYSFLENIIEPNDYIPYIKSVINARKNILMHILPESEFIQYMNPFFTKMTPAMIETSKYIKSHRLCAKHLYKDVDEMLFFFKLSAQLMHYNPISLMQFIITDRNQNARFTDFQAMQDNLEVFIDAYNDLPLWYSYGWSPNELPVSNLTLTLDSYMKKVSKSDFLSSPNKGKQLPNSNGLRFVTENDESEDDNIVESPQPQTPQYPKVGRNDPCPCGSGKKYKHCHGRN